MSSQSATNNRPGAIYHEKQTRQMCALHALNNLFQSSDAFSKADLDSIASSNLLSNSRNCIGYNFFSGNYDVNVIQLALQNKHYEAIWFNKAKDPSILNLNNIYGFILNIPNECDIWKSIATFFTASKRHWIAIKRFDSLYYNLDSKLKDPTEIGNADKLVEYLRRNLLESNAEIFIIVTKDVAQSSSWLTS